MGRMCGLEGQRLGGSPEWMGGVGSTSETLVPGLGARLPPQTFLLHTLSWGLR